MSNTSRDFLFKSYVLDEKTGLLSLHYEFEHGEAFEEIIQLPPLEDGQQPYYLKEGEDGKQAMDWACRILLLLAGVSYYKSRLPANLRCEAFALPSPLAQFIEKTYREGLGEFAWQNQIDLHEHINLIANEKAPNTPHAVALPTLPERTCVPVGGGKDSIVTLESLRDIGDDMILFRVGNAQPIADTIEISGLPSVQVLRKIDPLLIEMNHKGALNGHIPITAIVSAISVVTALWSGFRTIAFSHESSASSPTLTYLGSAINHQYSKSLEFERNFIDVVHHYVSTDLRYFSFLRPLTEVAIARRFAQYPQYFPVFRSCNRAFKIDENTRSKNWCCDCPKCRFVFLALSPFIEKPKMIEIFGQNMLDAPDHLEGFAELCGLSGHKPFECVGTIDECSLLMSKLGQMPEWKEDYVIKALSPKTTHKPDAFEQMFTPCFDGCCLPDRYLPAFTLHQPIP